MTRTIRTTATISIGHKSLTLTGCAEFDVIPGEPQTRDYPGSPSEVDDIDFHVCEVEYELADYDDETDRSDRFGYRTREELEHCAELADALCRSILAGGAYDDDLLADADCNGDEDYNDEDDC